MKKYKDRLIEIYRKQLEKAFWAYENPVEFQFLKYITTLIDISISKVARYWNLPNSYLTTKYKLKLLIAKELVETILSEIKPFLRVDLENIFQIRLKTLANTLKEECKNKKIIKKGEKLSKIKSKFLEDNQKLALATEALKRNFMQVLKDMNFYSEAIGIYENIKAYIKMFETEILCFFEE